MKRLHTLTLFAALAALTASCSLADGVGNEVTDTRGKGESAYAIYMKNTSSAGVLNIVAKTTGTSFIVSPYLSAPAPKDVQVTVAVDPATLEKYNKDNGFFFRPVEGADVQLSTASGQTGRGSLTVTIPEGQVTETVTVSIGRLDEAKYPVSDRLAIPLKIVSTTSGYPILSSPNSTIVTLSKEIITSAFHMNSSRTVGHYSQYFFPKDKTKVTDPKEWSLQFIAQFDRLTGNNQTTASLRGHKGFYNRISPGGMQVKSEGRDGEDTWTTEPVKQGEWLHVTYVYVDHVSYGSFKLYQNGKLAKEFKTSPMAIEEEGWGFGNENVNDYYLREVRFWTKALSPAEILDTYDLPLNPEHYPDLQAYFPMTRESFDEATKTFTDLCGNWTWSILPEWQWEIQDHIVVPADKVTLRLPEEPSADH